LKYLAIFKQKIKKIDWLLKNKIVPALAAEVKRAEVVQNQSSYPTMQGVLE